MGHYDSCRPGYCGMCGAGPGNIDAIKQGAPCPSGHDKCPHIGGKSKPKPPKKTVKATPLEKERELWHDSAGMRMFVQHGVLNLEYEGISLRVMPRAAQRKLPPGIEFHLRDSGRLTIQPEVSNVLVLRKESL